MSTVNEKPPDIFIIIIFNNKYKTYMYYILKH